MVQMICRNRVRNYSKWRRIFNADAKAHRAAGLRLKSVWREKGKRSNVFFLFDVASLRKAKAFIAAPDAKQQGKRAGVLDGEMHFLTSAALYKKA